MQAIITKDLPATNHRDARVKASCARGSITVAWDDALNPEENHRAAIIALLRVFVADDVKTYGINPLNSTWARVWSIGATGTGFAAVQKHYTSINPDDISP